MPTLGPTQPSEWQSLGVRLGNELQVIPMLSKGRDALVGVSPHLFSRRLPPNLGTGWLGQCNQPLPGLRPGREAELSGTRL